MCFRGLDRLVVVDLVWVWIFVWVSDRVIICFSVISMDIMLILIMIKLIRLFCLICFLMFGFFISVDSSVLCEGFSLNLINWLGVALVMVFVVFIKWVEGWWISLVIFLVLLLYFRYFLLVIRLNVLIWIILDFFFWLVVLIMEWLNLIILLDFVILCCSLN